MTTRLTRLQLLAFALVTTLAIGYGSVNYLNVGRFFAPPFEVRAEFKNAGGIYPRADVDLLGTRVGTVRRIVPGPGAGTTVVLALDHGRKIPRDLTATIGSKSAIGEQYVELEPKVNGGPVLAAGDVIGLDRTSSPIDTAQLLGDLNSLAASLPAADLTTAMNELSTGLDGVGGTLGHMIDNTDTVTASALANAGTLNNLIEDASTVLGTQVDQGPETAAYLRSLGSVSSEVQRIDGSLGDLFVSGTEAGIQVSDLLADNRSALQPLLNQLVSLTSMAGAHVSGLRKILAVFPWVLEIGATNVRRCGEYNPRTGKPIQSTCHYDKQGRPIYSTYVSVQLPELPGLPPFYPCTQGYQGTKKYTPDGLPVNGVGGRQHRDSPVNMSAGCTASPDDPRTPLVRGAQNIPLAWVLAPLSGGSGE